jgi:hypothetical protein
VPGEPGADRGVAVARRDAAEVAPAEVAEQVADLLGRTDVAPVRVHDDEHVRVRSEQAGEDVEPAEQVEPREPGAARAGPRLVVLPGGVQDAAEVEEQHAHRDTVEKTSPRVNAARRGDASTIGLFATHLTED